jgi:hypothetical protein
VQCWSPTRSMTGSSRTGPIARWNMCYTTVTLFVSPSLVCRTAVIARPSFSQRTKTNLPLQRKSFVQHHQKASEEMLDANSIKVPPASRQLQALNLTLFLVHELRPVTVSTDDRRICRYHHGDASNGIGSLSIVREWMTKGDGGRETYRK